MRLMTKSYKKLNSVQSVTNPKKNNSTHQPHTCVAGLSDQQIADYAGVSLQTAAHWRRGNRDPGEQACRLINLHRQGHVLPADWQRHTHFEGNALVDQFGNRFHPNQLAQTAFLRSLHNSALDELEKKKAQLQQAEDYIQYLEMMAERQKVTELPREKMRPSLTANVRESNPYFEGKRRKAD